MIKATRFYKVRLDLQGRYSPDTTCWDWHVRLQAMVGIDFSPITCLGSNKLVWPPVVHSFRRWDWGGCQEGPNIQYIPSEEVRLEV